eukprot:TRINITY_DN24817_c0_g1_i1.p1 TRINITY_DN24817_c0_g1~~TRINITY_DN24817_c0_g1_i1.p1  ORF type:complete len:180 (+),score=54.94 TRINITY_DN24817_c0_g1_i1:89-628(+)
MGRSRSFLSTGLVVAAGSYALFSTAFVGSQPQPRVPSVAMAGKKDGPLTPFVEGVRVIVGKEQLNDIRSKVIKAHGEMMGNFIDTADSPSGEYALKKLFEAADTDKSGSVDREELKVALQKLGFSWADDKKVENIFKKGDSDKNDLIDFDEFKSVAPVVLKQNLMKLAKENGGELGFLS